MSIPILHIFWKNGSHIATLQPATVRQRLISQLIDGIILGIIISFTLLLMSGGELYSVWISPLVPIFLVQVTSDYLPEFSHWWWGGYFTTVSLPYINDFKISFPGLLQWFIYAFYYIFFNYYYGQTPGKMLKGIVILANSHKSLTPLQAMLRWFFSIFSTILFGIGFWKNISDKNKKTWHDDFSQTAVYSFMDFDN